MSNILNFDALEKCKNGDGRIWAYMEDHEKCIITYAEKVGLRIEVYDGRKWEPKSDDALFLCEKCYRISNKQDLSTAFSGDALHQYRGAAELEVSELISTMEMIFGVEFKSIKIDRRLGTKVILKYKGEPPRVDFTDTLEVLGINFKKGGAK